MGTFSPICDKCGLPFSDGNAVASCPRCGNDIIKQRQDAQDGKQDDNKRND